jgi:hypothetical protein
VELQPYRRGRSREGVARRRLGRCHRHGLLLEPPVDRARSRPGLGMDARPAGGGCGGTRPSPPRRGGPPPTPNGA